MSLRRKNLQASNNSMKHNHSSIVSFLQQYFLDFPVVCKPAKFSQLNAHLDLHSRMHSVLTNLVIRGCFRFENLAISCYSAAFRTTQNIKATHTLYLCWRPHGIASQNAALGLAQNIQKINCYTQAVFQSSPPFFLSLHWTQSHPCILLGGIPDQSQFVRHSEVLHNKHALPYRKTNQTWEYIP